MRKRIKVSLGLEIGIGLGIGFIAGNRVRVRAQRGRCE